MVHLSQSQKAELAAVLLKLKVGDTNLTPAEWKLAAILEARGLTRFCGPKYEGPKVLSAAEEHNLMQVQALSHYKLSEAGMELVWLYSDDELATGCFLMPGVIPWYDSWPWKLLWPALVSLATALVVLAVKGSRKD